MDEPSLYERVGGMPFFERLAAAFYRGVAADPVLRRLYPEDDLGPAERRLCLFTAQYWGGPATYSDERGHPRLRGRHYPFPIGEAEREAWVRAMTAAVDECDPPEEERDELLAYFAMAAAAMVNRG